jgi:hypothetical protein
MKNLIQSIKILISKMHIIWFDFCSTDSINIVIIIINSKHEWISTNFLFEIWKNYPDFQNLLLQWNSECLDWNAILNIQIITFKILNTQCIKSKNFLNAY